MKTNAFVLIFCLSFLMGCKDSKKPAGVLTRAEMVDVLSDIYVAEEKLKMLSLSVDSSRTVYRIMKEKIFMEAGTNDSIYRVSYQYYMDHPKEMELIYTALVDSLQLKEQKTQQVGVK